MPSVRRSRTVSAILAFCFFCCSIVCWVNVRQILRDKQVVGVSMIPSYVFMTTNAFEVIYFGRLLDWWSASGAVSMLVGNGVWVILALYYRSRPREAPLPIDRLRQVHAEQAGFPGTTF